MGGSRFEGGRALKAVIMAGGKGTRLRPLTDHVPKPMVPVGPRRCIDYVLRSLSAANVREVIVTTGYLSEHVVRGIAGGAAHGVSVVYSFEDEPLGTAGGVRQVAPFLGGEAFVVASGDVLADINLARLIEAHQQNKARGALATLALTRVADPTQYGIVGLDAQGRIERFREKPRKEQVFSDLINAGIYVVESEVLQEIPPRQTYDFGRELWPDLLERGMMLCGEVIEGYWMDVGRPEELIEANVRVISREGRRLPGFPQAHVVMGPRVRLARDVQLTGAVYLGELCRIGAGASLTDSAVHGATAIEAGAQLTRALVMEDGEVGAGAKIEHSVLAPSVVVGEGAVIEACVIGEGVEIPAKSVRRGVRIPDT